ncbi:proteoglycan Cow-like [Portunus trituberculatus]|uniref:proteoglycan Cow-like n=1 Tax=Portunus trituberculatus TaxID=210409 RepID=UPI001E1CB9AE|nr:proteoglycan Cow-like [Portunus trituberculatus]
MKAVVLVLLVALWVGGEAKKKDGQQEDFEFVEDGKDHGVPGQRRLWMLDPDNALCGLLRCGRKEVCLLQDRFTAVCVNKAEVTSNGDKIIPMKDAASGPDNDLPKSWDALDDYDDDDDDEDYYDDEDEDEEYLLEDEDDEDDDKTQYGTLVHQQQPQTPEQQQQQQTSQPPQKAGAGEPQPQQQQRLNRRPFAEKQCTVCPVLKPVFLCGSDNRTYSSLCRIDRHNCLHNTAVRMVCKGFCPCKDTSPHLAKKERLRERKDAYLTKLRATTQDATGASAQTSSPAESSSRAEGRENNTRGGRGQQGRGGRREKHNKAGDKYNNRVRSRFGKNKKGGKGFKHSKDSYGRLDKYNAQRRPWSHRNNNDENKYKTSNTVWGPNECTQKALEAMGNRMLDWFSVIMADSRSRPTVANKAPSWCKPEVSWMLGHLDMDSDGRLSVKELYQLEHDDHERCIKPFIDRCDLDRDIFLSAREWCKCFDKSERPCAALRKASKGLLGGYIPECDSEGYYQPTQCHTGAQVCWCVDRHGVELPGTRTRNTPNCDAIVNSEEVSNYVGDDDDDAEDGDDDLDVVEGSADMPLDI